MKRRGSPCEDSQDPRPRTMYDDPETAMRPEDVPEVESDAEPEQDSEAVPDLTDSSYNGDDQAETIAQAVEALQRLKVHNRRAVIRNSGTQVVKSEKRSGVLGTYYQMLYDQDHKADPDDDDYRDGEDDYSDHGDRDDHGGDYDYGMDN